MIRKKNVILICLLALGILVYFLLADKKEPEIQGQSRFSVQTFERPLGWGYRIFDDTNAVVEQFYVPGIPGAHGFKDELQAERTGELVVKKLQSGIFPPTITQSELDSMDIDY